MINEKGLSPESADLIGQYVCLRGMLLDLYSDLAAVFVLRKKQSCILCVYMLCFDVLNIGDIIYCI